MSVQRSTVFEEEAARTTRELLLVILRTRPDYLSAEDPVAAMGAIHERMLESIVKNLETLLQARRLDAYDMDMTEGMHQALEEFKATVNMVTNMESIQG